MSKVLFKVILPFFFTEKQQQEGTFSSLPSWLLKAKSDWEQSIWFSDYSLLKEEMGEIAITAAAEDIINMIKYELFSYLWGQPLDEKIISLQLPISSQAVTNEFLLKIVNLQYFLSYYERKFIYY